MQQSDNGHQPAPANRNGAPDSVDTHSSKLHTPQLAESRGDNPIDDLVIKLAMEQLNVQKQIVETGRVRVHRTTSTRDEKVDIPLSSHTVEVRRVPIDKPIKQMPAVRATRKEIIIPVVEEVIVVERRLILREEVRIRRRETVRRHIEDVAVRAQHATVERLAPEGSEAGDIHAELSEGLSGTGRSSKQTKKRKKQRS